MGDVRTFIMNITHKRPRREGGREAHYLSRDGSQSYLAVIRMSSPRMWILGSAILITVSVSAANLRPVQFQFSFLNRRLFSFTDTQSFCVHLPLCVFLDAEFSRPLLGLSCAHQCMDVHDRTLLTNSSTAAVVVQIYKHSVRNRAVSRSN
jgi:hypothetical protein